MNINGLLHRKKGCLCILIGLCAVSVYIILTSGNQSNNRKDESYAVTIRHYGVDAREIERSITIPLEDELFSISNIISVQSSSENNLSRVFIRFKKYRRYQYEAVREVVQRVYERLPASVQRPEIYSSDNSAIPVWTAAFFNTSEKNNLDNIDIFMYLENNLKPKLKSLDGAGEVYVSGYGVKEIIVSIDQEKEAGLGLNSFDVARTLEMNDGLFQGGILVHEGREIIVTVDGRYGNDETSEEAVLEALANAYITVETGIAIRLSDIASVNVQERIPDTISRLNGRKTAIVSVMASSGADLQRLSRDIKQALENNVVPLEYIILSDKGLQEAEAFLSVFIAAIQGALMVALVCFFLNSRQLNRHKKQMSNIFCALFVPFVCVVSIAALSVFGFSLNRYILAGITAGIGSAINPVILYSDRLGKCNDYKKADSVLKELYNPLIAGSLTTIVSLIPLLSANTEIESVVWAIGIVTFTSLIFSLTILPPLLLWDINTSKLTDIAIKKNKLLSSVYHKFIRKLYRGLARNIRFCTKYPELISIAALIICGIGITAIIFCGISPIVDNSDDSVYGHIEFEGGMHSEETDRILAEFGQLLSEKQGILNVQTGARTGSGTTLISYNSNYINADNVKELARELPIANGFIFFPEKSLKEMHWNIKIAGDDDVKLMELAEELAYLARNVAIIKQQVFNFKEGSKKLKFLPAREKIAETGLSFSNVANTIRRNIYGPVIYKRKNYGKEIDVRINTNSGFNNDELNNFFYKGNIDKLVFNSGLNANDNNPVYLNSIMNILEENELTSIQRENRRRIASITVTTKNMDSRLVKTQLENVFANLKLPSGYTIEFDREAMKSVETISKTIILFLFAIIFCYMIIAVINESFIIPVVILSAILPSLAIPALYIAIFKGSFDIYIACAFIVVSGMTINAAALFSSNFSRLLKVHCIDRSITLYRIIRERIYTLIFITVTTIISFVPFLFLKNGTNNFVKNLALITSFGVSMSGICSITIVPAVFLIIRCRKRSIAGKIC